MEREPPSAGRAAGLCASRAAGTAVAATSAAPVPSMNLRREIGFLLLGLLMGTVLVQCCHSSRVVVGQARGLRRAHWPGPEFTARLPACGGEPQPPEYS